MEIKLNGLQTSIIAAGVLIETIVMFVALGKFRKEMHRANDGEIRAWLRGCTIQMQDFRIKELTQEITKLKSKN